jgi:translation initiation factor 2A
MWRPLPLSRIKVDPLAVPQVHASALTQSHGDGTTTTPVKAAGAYRPPHARGTATPVVFKREDEGGLPHIDGTPNGMSTTRERVVPGLAPTEPKDEKKLRSRKKKDKSEKPATEHPNGTNSATPPAAPVPEPAGISPEDLKKHRALLKKLRAIEELKLRQAGGEKLEKTQEQKIEKEMEIVRELAKLGFTE